MGFANYRLGDMGNSIQSCKRFVSINPDFSTPHVFLVVICTVPDQQYQAQDHAHEIQRLSPGFALGMCSCYFPETVTCRQFNDALAASGVKLSLIISCESVANVDMQRQTDLV
jgi:hypothetical protein